jgi:3'(2'), 5'-bisphosphate nucleotidase
MRRDDMGSDDLWSALEAAVIEAGRAVMAIYADADLGVTSKADGSPLTRADVAAEAAILETLARAAPHIPTVSEESAPPAAVGDRFFLVDPLDGTKEFLARNGEFTVNVALVARGVPIAGIVFAPALDRLYAGALGRGAWRSSPSARAPRVRISARRAPPSGLVAVASRSHADPATEVWLSDQPVAKRTSIGSSLKFCLLAEAAADVYPRFAPTMQWDTAAGDAVLRAAGGVTLGPDGAPLRYGPNAAGAGYLNPSFVAWGDRG